MRNFKFFHGFVSGLTTVHWVPPHNEIGNYNLDVEEELTNLLSQEIATEIDNNIIEELTRRINGLRPSIFDGEIQRFNDNIDYLNHYMGIGGQRA
jgi:hypothetical protein